MEEKKTKKTSKAKDDAKLSKKCRSCSLDCTRVRTLALMKYPDSEKKIRAISVFGSENAKYTPDTCPKR